MKYLAKMKDGRTYSCDVVFVTGLMVSFDALEEDERMKTPIDKELFPKKRVVAIVPLNDVLEVVPSE